MTYCLAIRVNRGLVFGSDSRTNAGVDYVTKFSKMHVFQPSTDRLFVVLCAGNLATTQEVFNHIQRDLQHPGEGENLTSARYLFEAAEYVGQISVTVQKRHAEALSASGMSPEASLILGGQIQGQPPEIMLIYPQGNYIAATDETPYLQIGESKYGKPNLDRLIDAGTSPADAARVALTSLDATARSNVTVGPPFEVAIYARDSLAVSHRMRFGQNSEYLLALRSAWSRGLQRTLDELPTFDWEAESQESQARSGC